MNGFKLEKYLFRFNKDLKLGLRLMKSYLLNFISVRILVKKNVPSFNELRVNGPFCLLLGVSFFQKEIKHSPQTLVV